MPLETNRLYLIEVTIPALEAELRGRDAFAELLGVRVPENWPPDLYDEAAIRWTINFLQQNPDAQGWAGWYVVLRGSDAENVLIGLVGYKGPPRDGAVEVGYGILEQYRRNGYATEATTALITRAFARPDVERVYAETYPHLTPSIGVLEKAGFSLDGPGSEEGVIRYKLERAAGGGRRAN